MASPSTTSASEALSASKLPGPVPEAQQWADFEVVTLVQWAQQTQYAGAQRRALEELVKRHQRNVYVALAHLAPERNDLADLTQEVLLRMCRSIGTLRNPAIFKPWLNRIITNLFYDTLRKQSRQLAPLSLDVPYGDEAEGPARDVVDPAPRPEHLALGSELDAVIYQAIQQLPEPFRTAVVLRDIQGLNYDEIAELMGCNLGTVKSRLARARDRLQTQLAPYMASS
ncbi:MAG: sigma-70 family RNA polymerase sigma factor [Vampirovibrionales bacterium]